ncbi:hypothetical protein OR1_01698 [Geobacter sp. OR-1]|uniref:hypothetical protein n=1 Tax=Geobacter sp. OR-1 TaxID=1266765 RepID=UPI000543E447|nr:hypothetical protein [Geobacter sp. OR-1]GAM09420.1 hypothetical protein OR1_01698 [Geobacter sp. OR-1]
MNNDMDRLYDEVLRVADAGTGDLAAAIEALLLRELGAMAPDDKIRHLDLLVNRLSGDVSPDSGGTAAESAQMSRLFYMLLGKELSAESLSSGEMTEQFVAAMNMIFDSLNRIVRVMQTTLVGESNELETIRQLIGSQMERYDGTMSVRDYLDQIQQAFLLSHNSFQQAARNVAAEIIAELDPDRISSAVGSGLKFGPLRKAEQFDIYEEKHRILADWLRSEQFTERLLREFEGICRKSYQG